MTHRAARRETESVTDRTVRGSAVTALAERPAAPPSAPPGVPGAWRRVLVRSVLAPATVLAPLSTVALIADHRYNIYLHGASLLAHPQELVTGNLRTIGMYLDFGNFRPLGRMLEWSVDLCAYLLIRLPHLPTEVAMRLVSAVAAMILAGAMTLFAEAVTARGRLFAAPPARPLALLPLGFAGCLVAAGPMSTTLLFGGLYFLSAALVLAVAAWICREPRHAALVVVAGAALAAFNEVAALALPLATVAVLLRGRIVLGLSWRDTLRRARPAALLWLGFLPVFVPIRVIIAHICARGDCYRASDLLVGPGAAAAMPNRLTAWLPPLQWLEAVDDSAIPGLLPILVALALFGLLAWRTVADLPRLPRPDRRQATALALSGATLLLLGAALGSLSARGQEAATTGQWGVGWRDSGLTAAGGTLATLGLLALATRLAFTRAAAVAFAIAAAGSAAVNQAYAGYTNRAPIAVLDNEIAAEVAQFDPSPAGDARRCALRERFATLMRKAPYSRFARGELPGTHSAVDRLDVTTGMATGQMYGRPFCRNR